MPGYFFGCPHCRAKLEAADATRAGRTVTCPKCQLPLLIPPPPVMGVPLSQQPSSPPASAEEVSGIVVSQDPGFKRPLSPAKAFSDDEGPPAAAGAPGFDKLPSQESLESSSPHVIHAADDVEGYSFTIPEKSSEPPPIPKSPKKKSKKSSKVEPPSPWEDPKYQLLAVLAVIVVAWGLTAFFRSKPDDEKTTQSAPVSTPPSPRASQAPATPTGGLPGGNSNPEPAPTTPRGGLPGSNGEAPPETKSPRPPATAPSQTGGLPGSAPNEATIPAEATETPPSNGEDTATDSEPVQE